MFHDLNQRHWLAKHRVTKPRGSIRRLLQSHYANGWQTYGRPVWDAQPLVYLVNTGRTTKNFGYRLAPRHRPILLTQATDSQRAACVAASKLLLRLVHLPEQPIMEQFLMGSYLYQLALTHKSLQKELLVQMLSQTVGWPYDSARLQDSDKEDEESLFVTPEYASRNQPEMYSIAGGMLQGVIRDVNPIDTIDLKRRAYRRSWMHIAGILTCGRLSGSLKPIVVRFLRQHGPHRSIPICEDRLVLAPSIPRLYPPCLLEWRVNYTGNNMGISLAFPDGLVSVIHVGCFTKAETLAGVAMALRTRAVQALTGWTVAFYTPDAILDIPGYTYVMDVFTSFELPPEWSTLNNIRPDRVFPTYPSCHNGDGEFLRRTPTPTVDSRP
ncbi:hypothetical protein P879_07610 [Paragonimus westermani]|uniref:Uncharacterized protein n=1 Tax=Paragonimus westermani TaxID=34504 RepID=A0A8T0D6I1_9TREM|nr:hypothetical protein P879_07610 [Paragonimus westermani]